MRFLKISSLLILLLCRFAGHSQTISDHFFGVNAWMPDTIGDHFYNGKIHKNWGNIQNSGCGIVRYGGISTDEHKPTDYQYIRMVDSIRAHGMEPILQVPFNNGQFTAQEAGAIVNYVNNTRSRKVKYWIIANEPNLSYSYTTAAQIAAYFRPFASAMKAADPSILIIGPETASFKKTMSDGLTNPGGPDDITGKDAAGRYYLDVFSFHTYPMGSGGGTRLELMTDLTKPGALQDDLAYLNNRLAAANAYHNRTAEAALKLAVTETNVNYTNSATDNLYGTGTYSFMGAQFVAEILGIGLKRGVDFMNLWSVIEGNSVQSNCGYIDKYTGGKQPIYHHFKLMADNFKGQFANCTSNLPAVKTFGCKNGSETCVLIMNEDSLSNYPYTVQLNTGSITAPSLLKINADAGITAQYTDQIPAQATLLLAFDASGNLTRKCEYFLYGHANAELPPQCTNYTTATGVAENNPGNSELNVYPNPSSGKFTIELDNPEDGIYDLQVLSTVGQVVMAEKAEFTGGKYEAELPAATAPGIYMVQVNTLRGPVTRKITVQR